MKLSDAEVNRRGRYAVDGFTSEMLLKLCSAREEVFAFNVQAPEEGGGSVVTERAEVER
jgi:hypothetical protein